REPLGEAFQEYGRAPGVRAREAGRIERRVHHHPQNQRKDLGKVLPETNDDRVQVRERVLRRVLGPEQLLEVRSPRAHRLEEELVLAAEALVEDSFGDAGGVRDLPCRRRMSLCAEDVSRDPEHLVVGDRLLAPHAAQYTAGASRVPTPPPPAGETRAANNLA